MHPQILPGQRKEPNFWAGTAPQDIPRNYAQYLRQFPRLDAAKVTLDWPELSTEGELYEERIHFVRPEDEKVVTGEASANTFFWVDPNLVYSYLPDLLIVIILRHPIERAFSHHRMYQRFQEEGRDLGFEVGSFADDMTKEIEALKRGDYAPSLAPSFYAKRLQRWQKVWEDNLLVFTTDELAKEKSCLALLATLEHRLGLRSYLNAEHIQSRYNQAPKQSMPPYLKPALAELFKTDIHATQALIGRKLGWLP